MYYITIPTEEVKRWEYIPRYIPAAYPGNLVLTPPPPGRRDDRRKKTKNACYIRASRKIARYLGEYCRGLPFTFCAKVGSHVCFESIDRGSPGATTISQDSSLVMTSNGKARIHGRRGPRGWRGLKDVNCKRADNAPYVSIIEITTMGRKAPSTSNVD